MLTGINAGKNNQMALNTVAAVSMDMKTNFKECSCRDGKQKKMIENAFLKQILQLLQEAAWPSGLSSKCHEIFLKT